MPRTWLSCRSDRCPTGEKAMSGTDFMKFFDEYLVRWNLTQADARDKKIWWAMFYTWKEGGYWYDDIKIGE